MGGHEVHNDRTKNGRVLKWYSNFSGAPIQERKIQSKKIFKELRSLGFYFVQKVEVKNANTVQDLDRICVFIDPI